MSTKVDVLPFPIGNTIYRGNATQLAADISSGDLKGSEFLGQKFEIEDRDYSSVLTVKPFRSNARRVIMAVRNMSGATLHRKRMWAMEIDTTDMVKHAAGYGATLYQQRCYPSDEFLTSAGIANRDVFYVVLEGPATCTNGAAADGTEIIADGDPLVVKAGSGATNADSGRVVIIDKTATNLAAAAHYNLVGFSMGVRLTTEVDSDILVWVRPH